MLITNGGARNRFRVIEIPGGSDEVPSSAAESVFGKKRLTPEFVELSERSLDSLGRSQVAEWQAKTWWVEPSSNRGNRASEGSVQHGNTLGR
jgi:hypothetical protein